MKYIIFTIAILVVSCAAPRVPLTTDHGTVISVETKSEVLQVLSENDPGKVTVVKVDELYECYIPTVQQIVQPIPEIKTFWAESLSEAEIRINQEKQNGWVLTGGVAPDKGFTGTRFLITMEK